MKDMSGRGMALGRTGGTRIALLALLATAAFCAMAGSAFAMKTPHVYIVGPGVHPTPPPNTTYSPTIQAAVDATKKGDWVLLEPGTYNEEVKVPKAHGGIHIRGLDRNTVILDGLHKKGNGIFVEGANNVWIENMTAHDFDGNEFCGGLTEVGLPSGPGRYGAARRSLALAGNAQEEAAAKNAHNYGGIGYAPPTGDAARPWHQHFGFVLVSCERADLRPLPNGVMIYGDAEAQLDALPRPEVPRAVSSSSGRRGR